MKTTGSITLDGTITAPLPKVLGKVMDQLTEKGESK